MTHVSYKTGDIFSSTAQALGHGCNTQGFMGAGIARAFRDRFPVMYEEYKARCDRGLLLPGEMFPWSIPGGVHTIYNIASQELLGANANYEWLASGVHKALLHAESLDIKTLALPRIGSGIGGLSEHKVEGVLLGLAASSPVDIELWTYQE